MTHLVLVFQVIVPVLFVYFFDRAAEAWYIKSSQQRQGARGSSAGAAGRAGASDTASDCSGGSGGGGGSPSPPPSSAAAESPGEGAAAAEPGGDVYEQQLSYKKPASAQPSAALVMLFGLGLAGVLFDVVLTVHTRFAPAGLS